MTTLLVSPRDFAIWRGVEYDPTDERSLIALEAASDMVRSVTGRQFDLVEDVPYSVGGSGTTLIVLPGPASGITEVREDDDEMDPSTYSLDGNILMRVDGYRWFTTSTYSITYDTGYSLAEPSQVPSDLQSAVMEMAARGLTMSSGAGTVREEQIGSYQVTYATATSGVLAGAAEPGVAATLLRYTVTLPV